MNKPDPAAILHLRSGRSFFALWGDPAEIDRSDHAGQAETIRNHAESGEAIFGHWGRRERNQGEIAVVFAAGAIEAVEVIL